MACHIHSKYFVQILTICILIHIDSRDILQHILYIRADNFISLPIINLAQYEIILTFNLYLYQLDFFQVHHKSQTKASWSSILKVIYKILIELSLQNLIISIPPDLTKYSNMGFTILSNISNWQLIDKLWTRPSLRTSYKALVALSIWHCLVFIKLPVHVRTPRQLKSLTISNCFPLYKHNSSILEVVFLRNSSLYFFRYLP